MAKYYEGLLPHLCEHGGVDSIVTFVSPWNAGLALPEHPKIEEAVCHGLPRWRAGRILYEQLALPLFAARRRVDVLLSTCNVRPRLWHGPSAVVLQSMQHAFLPVKTRRFRAGYLDRVIPVSLRTADIVIAVTETSRRDAIELFGLDPARVLAVPHGASDWTLAVMDGSTPVVPHELSDGRPYVLALSRLYELKNHRRVIEAFALLVAREGVSHALVIAGGEADLTVAEVQAIARRAGVADRVHVLGSVPQEQIPPLYQGADAVAYVSLYETFGHPVLEALAFRRPLLTSTRGATAEVAGQAARLADPYDVESIADGLRDVLLDESLRARLAVAGPERVQNFSWAACADASYGAMRQAIEGRSGIAGG